MSSLLCCVCRATSSAYVCRACCRDLEAELATVHALAEDVDAMVSGQLRRPAGAGRSAPDPDDGQGRPSGGLRVTPLPFDPGAAERAAAARSVISGAGLSYRHATPGRLEFIRHHPSAVTLWPALRRACSDLLRLLDGPEPLRLAGYCGKDRAPLYVRRGRAVVRCPRCRTSRSVEQVHAASVAAAGGAVVHAALAASLLSLLLDRTVTSSSVRNLAHRGQLQRAGVDGRGRPLYRLVDVRRALSPA